MPSRKEGQTRIPAQERFTVPAAAEEQAHRKILDRYHELVDRKFLANGLSEAEQSELESLRKAVEDFYAPFDLQVLENMKAHSV